MRRQVRGVSFMGFIAFLVVAGVIAYFGMRLGPAYSEYYSVVSSMEGLAKEADVGSMTAGEIKDRLRKRFQISYVDSVTMDDVKVRKNNGQVEINVAYLVERPFIYNITFVLSFDKTVTVSRSGGGPSE